MRAFAGLHATAKARKFALSIIWSIPDGRAAMTEYEAQARAIREKTARLKRPMAKEAKTVIAL